MELRGSIQAASVFHRVRFQAASVSNRGQFVPMSTETTISLILFLGALLLVWRTRRGLIQERERAREAGPENLRGPGGKLDGTSGADPGGEQPPEPVAVLEAALETSPLETTQGVEPANLATGETTVEAPVETTAGITRETTADAEKKPGAESDRKPAVKTEPGPTPEPISISEKEPVEISAIKGDGKLGTAAMEDADTEMETGRGMAPGTNTGRDADGRVAADSSGKPAMAPAGKMPPEGDSPPEAPNRDARDQQPRTRAAGQAPRRSTAKFPAKSPADRTPPDKVD